MIFESKLPLVGLTDLSITERVFEGLEPRADAIVMIDGITGETISGGALMERIRRLAGGLTARGHGAGAITALMAPNCIDFVTAFHGAAYAGGTVTTVNPNYTAEELHRQLVDSAATLLITTPDALDKARAGADSTKVRDIVVIGHAEGATALDALMGGALQSQAPVDVAEAVVALPYSSGTTGLPKGVCLTHRNLVVNIDQSVKMFPPVLPGDTTVAILPFFHMFGLTVLVNYTLAQQGCVVSMPRFDLEPFLQLVQDHRVRQLYVVPPVIVALAKHPLVDNYDLSCVEMIISGAAPLGANVAQAAQDRLDCSVVQGWGMTEVTTVGSGASPEWDRPGTVGLVVSNAALRITDTETGEDVPIGTPGELWVRGPHVMKSYLNRPEETSKTLTPDGWLRTGDVADIDDDGYLTLHDRLKELIKVNGFQVAPAELESVLLTHPQISDAAVIGRPDERAGERPVAYVVLADGAPMNEAAIKDYVLEHLAHYKALGEVHFVGAIPKSPSGKILRRVLRRST